MSTRYGYYCSKCDTSSDHWFNHGQDILIEVLSNWKLIEQLEATNHLTVSIFSHDFESAGVFDFVKEHYGHGLYLEDEYGRRK